jgi:hypothetical protein
MCELRSIATGQAAFDAISLVEDAFGRGYSPVVERVRCLQ